MRSLIVRNSDSKEKYLIKIYVNFSNINYNEILKSLPNNVDILLTDEEEFKDYTLTYINPLRMDFDDDPILDSGNENKPKEKIFYDKLPHKPKIKSNHFFKNKNKTMRINQPRK